MKKIIAISLSVFVLLSSTVAFANQSHKEKENKKISQKTFSFTKDTKKCDADNKSNKSSEKASVKINLAVIKYGHLKLPVAPIEKGLGAKVTYDNSKHIITVTKDATIIVLDLNNRKITINGVEEQQKVLSSPSKNKMSVLMKYIAEKLGYKVEIYDGNVFIITPSVLPTPTVTPIPTATPAPTPTPAP
jgi:hypothetical protein